jgi:sRNA-binding carbon storage regulator CsrA
MLVISRKVDEWIQIGDDVLVGPTDIDMNGVRLLAHGRMLGGAEDGAAFKKTQEVALGGEMWIGPHVVVTVLHISGPAGGGLVARLGVNRPKHVRVFRKEVADALKRERDAG